MCSMYPAKIFGISPYRLWFRSYVESCARTRHRNEQTPWFVNDACRCLKSAALAIVVMLLTGLSSAIADTHYVNVSNEFPSTPFTSWETAAITIQEAIDVASPGDTVLVAEGTYDTGRKVVHGGLANRIAITKTITVSSVDGPANTMIVGQGPLGETAVRCAYVGTNAVLDGFTLTGGHTRRTGISVWDRSGGGVWCESSAMLTNCVISGNDAASNGGGAYRGTLNNCTLTGNSASENGGGAYRGTLNNCTLTGNSASENGGGAARGTLNNCTLTGNSASENGGGAYSGTLNNCTLTGNSASENGGGASGGALNNCIVYFNEANIDANYTSSSELQYCCTTPLPVGEGNIDDDPHLADLSHLNENSPCIGAGANAYTIGTDIDGEAWLDPPSIGCDEYMSSSATGSLSVSIQGETTNVATGFVVDFVGDVQGHATFSVWDFGDGSAMVSNNLYASHAWDFPGTYQVELKTYNITHPQGVATTVLVDVVEQSVHFVIEGHTNDVYPYTSWGTAASTIQDGIDASVWGGLVLVTNGIYATGGVVVHDALTNRIAVTKPVTVRSVNGPNYTVIVGKGPRGEAAVRCAYVGTNAVLDGFTLTGGHTRSTGDFRTETSGGGVWCEFSAMLTNCVISGNDAAGEGGGAYRGTLNNCTLTGNSARDGGGASGGTLNNSMLTRNSASDEGGGASESTLNNCTVTGNSARDGGGGADDCTLNNCTVTGNSAMYGGGAFFGTLNNCNRDGQFCLRGRRRSDFRHVEQLHCVFQRSKHRRKLRVLRITILLYDPTSCRGGQYRQGSASC